LLVVGAAAFPPLVLLLLLLLLSLYRIQPLPLPLPLPALLLIRAMIPTALRLARRPSIQFLGKEGWAAKLSAPVAAPVAGSAALATPTPATVAMASSSAAAPTPTPAVAAAAAVATHIVPEAVTTVPSSLYSDTPASNMRKVISRRLTESKSTVPHFYTSIEIPLDNILQLRKVLDKQFDTKVSVNDFIIKASAMALRDVPELNATYNTKAQSQRSFDNVDISVAVATPTGLITPIIPSTTSLSLTDISSKVKDLATRARDNKLTPEEYQGGTFCISNLGMFGISEFSAVINPPQGAILAVGGGERKIVPGKVNVESGTKERPGIQTIMTARLSADRRVVDEATASLFMGVLKEYLSQPKLMML
jgi:pyruvate dehydrogenase E2 component (dihydrolipoamide acetyltransferase)